MLSHPFKPIPPPYEHTYSASTQPVKQISIRGSPTTEQRRPSPNKQIFQEEMLWRSTRQSSPSRNENTDNRKSPSKSQMDSVWSTSQHMAQDSKKVGTNRIFSEEYNIQVNPFKPNQHIIPPAPSPSVQHINIKPAASKPRTQIDSIYGLPIIETYPNKILEKLNHYYSKKYLNSSDLWIMGNPNPTPNSITKIKELCTIPRQLPIGNTSQICVDGFSCRYELPGHRDGGVLGMLWISMCHLAFEPVISSVEDHNTHINFSIEEVKEIDKQKRCSTVTLRFILQTNHMHTFTGFLKDMDMF
eukprot:NODE_4957_length_1090_cov_15.817994_g4404_i0.p1 GENE.NODE_4957_length_1090_cov_15.817994_g4404_i0~~NODE_4957_length_1090_cov_15.817994_g4404_i0.p1  ORF type:complete len:343 (-),score=61.86 NODE_4957_length_1090_cov_15.817994_g4404_i0:62-964(-)